MASNTFTKIATVTVGSGGASTIDFTSIPSTYTDLCLKISVRDNKAAVANYFDFKLNGVTTNFTGRYLYYTGTTTGSGIQSYYGAPSNGANSTTSTFANAEMYIPNYASSNYKSISIDGVLETNATGGEGSMNAQLWSNTAAINQITLFPEASASFVQYSSATLYGVKNS